MINIVEYVVYKRIVDICIYKKINWLKINVFWFFNIGMFWKRFYVNKLNDFDF